MATTPLWDAEILYNDDRIALYDPLAGDKVTTTAVDALLRNHDKTLHVEMGYSPKRFPRPFTGTATHFFGEGEPIPKGIEPSSHRR